MGWLHGQHVSGSVTPVSCGDQGCRAHRGCGEVYVCKGMQQNSQRSEVMFPASTPKAFWKFLYSGLFSGFHNISPSALESCSPNTLFLPSATGGGKHSASLDNWSGASWSGGQILGTISAQLFYSCTSDSIVLIWLKMAFHQPHAPGFPNNIWLWPLILPW